MKSNRHWEAQQLIIKQYGGLMQAVPPFCTSPQVHSLLDAFLCFSCQLIRKRIPYANPHDSDDAWSFGIKAPTTSSGERYFEGTLIYAGPDFIDPSLYAWQIAQGWEPTDLPLAVIPLTLLQIHVDRTSVKLTELPRRVEGVERDVLESSSTTDFDPLIHTLHACDADLIKLERRWYFEKELTAAVLDVIGRYKQPETNYQEVHFNGCDISPTDNGLVNINLANSSDRIQGPEFLNAKPFKVLDSVAILQEQRSRAFGYDLGVLPRRIQN